VGGGDGRNSADFRNTVCGNAFGQNVLAITLTLTWPSQLGYDQTSQTDIVFNSNYNWNIYSGANRRGEIDFGRVALHELGHALGLGHENSLRSIMSSNIGDLDTLQIDDIAGVSSLYGPPGNCAFSNINLNTRVNEALGAGDCRVMDLFGGNGDPSFMDVYQFSLDQPTFVNIQMQSNELDPVLIITDTSLGNQMIFDDFNGTCDATVSQTLPAGNYLLIANTYVVPEKCAGNVGNYSITMTDSVLPLLGTVINTNASAQVTPMVFSGGASVDGFNFRTSFNPWEFVDVRAQLAPDPAHVGMSGSIYVLATLSNGKQYMKNSAGAFVLYTGGMANLIPYRQGPLAALEQVSIIEDLNGNSTGLAGQTFWVYVGYATNTAPLDVYHNSTAIQFSIAP
jgi:hypothetical protein